MSSSALFIYNNPLDGRNGGSLITRRNLKMVEQSFDSVDAIHIAMKKVCELSAIQKIYTTLRNLLGYAGGLTKQQIENILRMIQNKRYCFVFIDTSIYGRLCRIVKLKFPSMPVLVFFHNCEYQFARERVQVDGPLFIPILFSVYLNEKSSLIYADSNVFLNERDLRKTEERYRVKLDKAKIIPISMPDTFDPCSDADMLQKEPYLLFVGSAFYANIEAVKWLINNLAGRIESKIVIVGSGMMASFPEHIKDLEIFDFVNDLSVMYAGACAVILPIYYGSGMKVKTCEALMYGKKIIGSQEAFEGYDINPACMIVCHSVDEYIKAIDNLDGSAFCQEARDMYLTKYSERAVSSMIKNAIDNTRAIFWSKK